MVPMDGEGVTVMYKRGEQFALTQADDLDAMVQGEYDRQQLQFIFSIGNSSDEAKLVTDSSITLYVGDSRFGPWDELDVYRAEEYYKQRKRQIVTGQILMVFSAALEASTAGYSSGTVSGFDSTGQYYSARYTSYDSGLASLEMQMISMRTANYIEGGSSELDWLENNLLYPSHIMPDTSYTGVVYTDAASPGKQWYRLNYNFGSQKDQEIIFRLYED